jgi:hypothetical protein
MLDDVADLLADHLSIADLFRLARAVGREISPDVAALLSRRMGFKRTHTAPQISIRMRKGRCVECGQRCFRRPALCGPCGKRYLVTRTEVLSALRRLIPAKRGQSGAFYYWRSEVVALF